MDTSKEYIKMCEKADEIQKIRTIFPSINDIGKIGHLGCSPTGDFAYSSETEFVWLPRQDQLLEMINWEYELQFIQHKPNIEKERTHFCRWISKEIEIIYGNSFEKVLLQMLVQEKFNKTWNGENWIAL